MRTSSAALATHVGRIHFDYRAQHRRTNANTHIARLTTTIDCVFCDECVCKKVGICVDLCASFCWFSFLFAVLSYGAQAMVLVQNAYTDIEVQRIFRYSVYNKYTYKYIHVIMTGGTWRTHATATAAVAYA